MSKIEGVLKYDDIPKGEIDPQKILKAKAIRQFEAGVRDSDKEFQDRQNGEKSGVAKPNPKEVVGNA